MRVGGTQSQGGPARGDPNQSGPHLCLVSAGGNSLIPISIQVARSSVHNQKETTKHKLAAQTSPSFPKSGPRTAAPPSMPVTDMQMTGVPRPGHRRLGLPLPLPLSWPSPLPASILPASNSATLAPALARLERGSQVSSKEL